MLRETGNEDQILNRTAEVAAAIAEEGLRYVSDSARGYTRKRTGTTFNYYDKHGRCIIDAAVIRRIKSIGIPPAYESVWICPSASATSRRPARCVGSQAVSLSPEVAQTSRPEQV